jgi:hypothetical protein
MSKPAEESALARFDQRGRIPAELAVEVGLKEGVLRTKDVVTVRAETRELGGEADGCTPVFRVHQVAQVGQLSLHGAGDKESAWKLKGIDQ